MGSKRMFLFIQYDKLNDITLWVYVHIKTWVDKLLKLPEREQVLFSSTFWFFETWWNKKDYAIHLSAMFMRSSHGVIS